MTAISIRAYHPSDLPSLYRICHATGWNGLDASSLVADPDLIGHSYVGPYVRFEPALCFVAQQRDKIVGYILATADTASFHHTCETHWFPLLRTRYPLPSPDDTSLTAQFIRTIHRGHPPSAAIDLAQYPASLHIDLLPQAQRQGAGRQLMEQLFATLRTLRAPGVHLYVSRANQGAISFYERIGFKCLDEAKTIRGYGFTLR
jgi:ribosomal protein S18 acetylase RimI-like enzyme